MKRIEIDAIRLTHDFTEKISKDGKYLVSYEKRNMEMKIECKRNDNPNIKSVLKLPHESKLIFLSGNYSNFNDYIKQNLRNVVEN